MQFNLLKSFKSQAKGLAKTIKNMSPKVVPVKVPNGEVIDKSIIQRGVKKFTKDSGKYELFSNIIQNVLKDKDTKEARYKQQDKLARESIYNVLLSQYMEDTFGIDPEDKVVTVEILDDDNDIRNLLQVFPDDMLERTELDELLTDNLQDTYLKYGELFFKKHYNNGIVIELEKLEGQYVYPICNGSGILFYIIIDPICNDFTIIDSKNILAFMFKPETKNIVSGDKTLEALLCKYPDELKAEIPNSYKIGTPLLYNARNELTKLRIANLLNDISQLKKLAFPTLLGVNVENIRDEEQLSEMLDTYEEYLEDALSLPDLNTDVSDENTDMESLVNSAIKVIPVEGSGKNGLSSIDLTSGIDTDDTYLNNKKEEVALASGFPVSAVYAQSTENSKTDLSQNRRYRNRCKAGQRYIVRPITEWVFEDFDAQKIDITSEQVKVFCKPIVSLDTAEDLEISLGAITQASQVYEQLLIINDNSQEYGIDEEGYYDYFQALLSPFKGAQRLLKKKETPVEENLENDINNDINIDINSPSFSSPNSLDRTGIDLDEFESETTTELEVPSIEETTETELPEGDIT